jgi:hypothetical protein
MIIVDHERVPEQPLQVSLGFFSLSAGGSETERD